MCMLPHTALDDAPLLPLFCSQKSTSSGLGFSSSQSFHPPPDNEISQHIAMLLFLFYCPQEVHFSFGFRWSFSTDAHRNTAKTSLFCWTVLALICAITPPSIIAPSFASLSAFSLPSVMHFFEERHWLLLFLGAMHIDMPTSMPS